jgi:hypothetical protein
VGCEEERLYHATQWDSYTNKPLVTTAVYCLMPTCAWSANLCNMPGPT